MKSPIRFTKEFDTLSNPFYENDTTQFSLNDPISIRRTVTGPARTSVRPHFHNTLELVYFYDGKGGTVSVDGVTHQYHARDIIVIRPYAMHGYTLVSDAQRFLLCKIEVSYLNELFGNAVIRADMRAVVDALCRLIPVQRPAAGLVRALEAMRGDRATIIGRFLELGELIKPMSGAAPASEGASAFGHLLAYLDKHYHSKIRLSDAASHTGLSKYYFAHRFKAIYGVSFMDFVTKIRLSKAENLLRYTDRSVGDIALSVGFSDLAYFTRMFRKYRGKTPREFRAQTVALFPRL
ncbi:MAG: AraC family transcriptional regulator [Spirochaetota bacterium]